MTGWDKLFRWCVAVCFVLGTATATAAQDRRAGLSQWYATFNLGPRAQGFMISAEIIHFSGLSTGVADLRISRMPGSPCSGDMQASLCRVIQASADTMGNVQAHVGDTLFEPQDSGAGQFTINFRLGGEVADYRLVLTADARGYTAAIYGPDDSAPMWSGFAQSGPHFCEQTMCADDIFLLAKGQALPWDTQPPETVSPENQLWHAPETMLEIIDVTGRSLGNVTFGGDPQGPTATGALFGVFGTLTAHETQFTFAIQTAAAITFDLTVIDAASRAQKSGALLLEISDDATAMRGTLIVGTDVFVISLAPFDAVANTDQDDAFYDNPGFGIYKYTYGLKDIPQGRELALRQSPDRSAAVVIMLDKQTHALQINRCVPEIDNIAFDEATAATQDAVLARVWCEIYANDALGWIPGRYLAAQR